MCIHYDVNPYFRNRLNANVAIFSFIYVFFNIIKKPSQVNVTVLKFILGEIYWQYFFIIS
jgi:hypothetical protein